MELEQQPFQVLAWCSIEIFFPRARCPFHIFIHEFLCCAAHRTGRVCILGAVSTQRYRYKFRVRRPFVFIRGRYTCQVQERSGVWGEFFGGCWWVVVGVFLLLGEGVEEFPLFEVSGIFQCSEGNLKNSNTLFLKTIFTNNGTVNISHSTTKTIGMRANLRF